MNDKQDASSSEPWTTLGYVRDDLRQARAHLRKRAQKFRTNDDAQAAICIERALARIGDGTREEQS